MKIKKGFYPLNIQLFAEDSQDETDGADSGGNSDGNADTNGSGDAQNNNRQQENGKGDNKGKNTGLSPEVERLLQSATDRIRNEYGNRIKGLEEQLETARKNNMTASELAEYEKNQREKELADRESKITDRENRYFALQEVTGLNYSVNGEQAEQLVSLVMAADKESIKANVTALKNVVDSLVKAEIDKTFKANGTAPRGGKNGGSHENDKTSVAVSLGKAAAERGKGTQNVLNQYLNRKG